MNGQFVRTDLRATYCEDDFYFEISPESRSVKSGEHLQLQCRVSNDQHIMYTWTLNGGNIYNTSRRFQHSNNLTILRTDPFLDSGTISCIATNTTSGFSITSLPAKLNIQCNYELTIKLKTIILIRIEPFVRQMPCTY